MACCVSTSVCFPEQARRNAGWIAVLAIIGVIYGALVAMVQPNLKKLVAYSSISHLGFVVLGIFSFTVAGIDGAVYQMLNHGISTGALFILCGFIYERRHTYEISQYGGLATPMPVYATFFLVITLSSIGLPLLNGFIGEYLILSGSFQANAWWGVLRPAVSSGAPATCCGSISGSSMERCTTGERFLPDLLHRERSCLWPLAIAALVMGVAPSMWMNRIDHSVARMLMPLQKQADAPVQRKVAPPAAAEAAPATAGHSQEQNFTPTRANRSARRGARTAALSGGSV